MYRRPYDSADGEPIPVLDQKGFKSGIIGSTPGLETTNSRVTAPGGFPVCSNQASSGLGEGWKGPGGKGGVPSVLIQVDSGTLLGQSQTPPFSPGSLHRFHTFRDTIRALAVRIGIFRKMNLTG
jgi:hypothetical protein